MRYIINKYSLLQTLTFLSLLLLSGCVMEKAKETENDFVRPGVHIDLPEILKKGKLTVLAENSATSYFIYRGKKMGFEYEMLKKFTEELGVALEVKIVRNLDSLISMLNRGEGDIIACNYTVTNERSRIISFSEPFIQTQQVLIQRKPDGWEKMKEKEWSKKLIWDPSQLARKEVHVWQNSSYYDRLMHLKDEIGDTIFIEPVPGTMGGEELIEMVSNGLIDYTIAEENVAKVNERFYDNLIIGPDLSVKQKIAFGMRKTSYLLKAKLDEWLTSFMNKPVYKYISRKYFELGQVTHNYNKDHASLDGKHISAYDDIFRKVGAQTGWDWRLIASIAYQESKFNPNALSFGGAYGMMQFMPNTGPHYGVYPDSPPEVQILGGAKKLQSDEKFWMNVPDELQRKKFAIASYNAGRGHIQDAQKLAKKHGLDHLKWDDNVEKMMLNLSKQEYYQDEVVRNGMLRGTTTYNYIHHVFDRYLEWVSVYE